MRIGTNAVDQRSNRFAVRMRLPLLALGAILLIPACGRDGGGGSVAPAPVEIAFPGVGSKGIFDPSLAADAAGEKVWMAYSEVLDSFLWPGRNDRIQSRLARSDDAGATWTDANVPLNAAEDVVLPQAPPNDAGTWNHEVPALVHDPGAPAAEQWKVLWHRYLWVNGARAFQHGWIALKSAPSPTGP